MQFRSEEQVTKVMDIIAFIPCTEKCAMCVCVL